LTKTFVNNDHHCSSQQQTMTAGFWQASSLTVWQRQWQSLMAGIAVIVDGVDGGNEPTAPMAALLKMTAVDVSSDNGYHHLPQ
jgi:hypothetical protein